MKEELPVNQMKEEIRMDKPNPRQARKSLPVAALPVAVAADAIDLTTPEVSKKYGCHTCES